jgi:hypothetical protein
VDLISSLYFGVDFKLNGYLWRQIQSNSKQMDGIIEFLIIAAVIGVGVLREYYKKEDRKEADAKPVVPYPQEVVQQRTPPAPPSYTKKKKKTSRPFFADEEGVRTTTTPAVSSILPTNTPDAAPEEEMTGNEYTINSAEEARKAIIWGEILQRKY